MSHFAEMEWNSKWDWENFVGFGSRAIESPKKLQLADWMMVDDGEIVAGSFNLSRTGGNSGASGSDDGHGSSAKSSISASTDSSQKDGEQTPNFSFTTFEGSSGNFSQKMEMKAEVSVPHLDTSVSSIEPLIGLKLGKRTYFENSSGGGNSKASLAVVPATSKSMAKKTKLSSHAPVTRCQVEGCNIDLSMAKGYHRRHRVCESHSKCPKVIVGGLERRFCQQCSRFHNLSEFDEKKRSCRRRLSDHNARRRKPQQETIKFNSNRLSSPIYGGRQQISFLLNNASLVNSISPINSTWNSTCSSKFTLTKGYLSKFNVDGGDGGQLHVKDVKVPHDVTMHSNTTNGLLASKNPTPDLFAPGSKRCLISSHVDAAPEFRRALSLLSSNSWGSCGAESIQVHNHPMHESDTGMTQPLMHSIPESMPLSSSELWLGGQQSTHPPLQALATSNSFQEIQLFRTPYEADFYSNTVLN